MKADPAAQRRDQRHAAALRAPVLHERLEAGVDTSIRGCTHFPFARCAIERLAGPSVEIFDPTPSVARRAADLRGRHPDLVRCPRSEESASFLTLGNPTTDGTAILRLARPTLAGRSHFGPRPTGQLHAPHLRSA